MNKSTTTEEKAGASQKSLYQQLKDAGIPVANHESDLYVKATEQARAIIKNYRPLWNVSTFRNNIDKEIWFDLPFAYEPFWDRVNERSAKMKQKALA